MPNYKSLRLAQFWESRLKTFTEKTVQKPLVVSEPVLEAGGWLIEGVFCGYFDPREADVIWTRFRPVMEQQLHRPETLAYPGMEELVLPLLNSNEPFRYADQMTEGAQKEFELGLFSHALLVADRFASDGPAFDCMHELQRLPENEWSTTLIVDSETVLGAKLSEESLEDISDMVTGYLRVMEHMEASRRFFDFAKERSGRADFNSYCQRIGRLNAWRVPILDHTVRRRFENDLPRLFELSLRSSVQDQIPNPNWAEFAAIFKTYRRMLLQAWEVHHFQAFLVNA